MRIMLACASGMSTSMLVEKMKEASKANGEDHKIWAVAQEQVEEELGNFDVLLLGPQIAIQLDRMKKLVGDRAPVAVIKPVDYGRLNGKAVVETAKKLVEGE